MGLTLPIPLRPRVFMLALTDYSLFLGKRNVFTPDACPEPDLTVALSEVLKLLLSSADFRHSALEPCPWP